MRNALSLMVLVVASLAMVKTTSGCRGHDLESGFDDDAINKEARGIIAKFQRMLDRGEPIPASAYHHRARAHLHLQQYDEAALWATRGINQPGQVSLSHLYLLRGDANRAVGRLREARKDYEKVVRLYPSWDTGRGRLESLDSMSD